MINKALKLFFLMGKYLIELFFIGHKFNDFYDSNLLKKSFFF